MKPERRVATEEDLRQAGIKGSATPSAEAAATHPKQGGEFKKPKVRLGYEHIEHLHRGDKNFERAICRNDFVRKYSQYQNILQVLALFRERHG